jgi:hypothetical protein
MKRAILIVLAGAAILAGCGDSNADKASENLGKLCERFECQRKIIAYNGITDKAILDVEGRCSLEQNPALPRNLELMCKQGPDDYRKHFVGLADNVSWTSVQLEPLDVSEYRTKFIIRPESIIPDLDLVTGDSP